MISTSGFVVHAATLFPGLDTPWRQVTGIVGGRCPGCVAGRPHMASFDFNFNFNFALAEDGVSDSYDVKK